MKPWLLVVVLLNVAAAAMYVAVGLDSGLLQHVRTDPGGFFSIFSSNDSLEYRAVANWIFGGPRPASGAWRPFLYPLLLGGAQRLGGLTGIWLLNVALWFATLNLAALATYRFVRSKWAAAVVFLALAANASLIALTFKGLTEITTVALLAMWILGITHLTSRPTYLQVVWGLLPPALLTIVKPEFEVLLAVTAVLLAIGIARNAVGRKSAVAAFVACLVPVGSQVALMVQNYGYLGISTIGARTIRNYYLPRFEIAIGQTNDYTVLQAQNASMSDIDIVRLLMNHPAEAINVYVTSLKENMLANSGFLLGHPRLEAFVVLTQEVYFVMVLVLVPLALIALWRKRDGRLALVWLGALTVFAAGGLTHSQSDRITIVALPASLVAFVVALDQAGGREAFQALTARLSMASSPAAAGSGPTSPG